MEACSASHAAPAASGLGGKRQPVAHLSKLLDPVSRGWPECVQAAAATALLVGESRKLNPAAFLWRGGNGLHLFIDGSSRVIQGKRHNGCAIIEGVNGEIRETGRLPNNWSAQTCQP